MSEKKYLVDGEPCTAFDLIDKAKSEDAPYAARCRATSMAFTSDAAEVLRGLGYTVETEAKP